MSVQGMHGRAAASGTTAARHRADRSPELRPRARPSRHAHLNRRRQAVVLVRWMIGVLALAVLLGVALGSWRMLRDDGAEASRVVSDPRPPARTTTVASIDADGDVQVSLDVVRPATSATPVLVVPDRPGTGFAPRVTVGRLLADTVPVDVAGTLVPGGALEVPAPGARATRLVLEYTATGTYVASKPSSPGRGRPIAWIRSLISLVMCGITWTVSPR